MTKDDVVIPAATQTAVAKAVEQTTGPEVTKVEASVNTAMVLKAINEDPELQNKFSQEKWWQSGVQFFGSGGVIWALGILFTDLAEHGADFGAYDMKADVAALGALGMAVGVLYRRFVPGLKPLFSGWFGAK